MFGLIISSRPVLTPPTAISETQFAFSFPAAPSFAHIVIFLLPGTSLPPDTAAGVYIQLPTATGPGEFKLLGAIANEKPSAIFKVSGSTSGSGTAADQDAMVDDNTVGGATVTVGISVEPVANIAAALQNLKSSVANTSATPSFQPTGSELVLSRSQPVRVATKVLAQRIISNAFNFLASFSGNRGGEETIPLKAFKDWWMKFERRIDVDPTFLERADDNS
ncbi:DUF775-domain-containing protein [Aulographum hederae CBS 113979]|uniref:DUF775-domain-containing protein n=1 Tax=Aulographum hederae CBS 113979 TaxID=1176131 RepID=A0A6G1GML5_9PEZI|nr:DUF775-domain-containing protein [Aulographum hederae CBS 113979]